MRGVTSATRPFATVRPSAPTSGTARTYRSRQPTPGRAGRRLPIRRASLGSALPKADESQAEFDASEDLGSHPSMPEAQSQRPHTGPAEFRALLAAQERRRQEEAAEARKQGR